MSQADAAGQPTIVLPRMGDRLGNLWATILEMSNWPLDGWTLIGGQMVFLHALIAHADPPRVSEDIDTVVNTRAVPPKLRLLVAALEENGFEPSVSPDSVAHRWHREGVVVDVMTAEGTGERTDVRTSGHFETIPVDGATQALNRSSRIPVSFPERDLFANVPLPSLAGAVVIKSAAAMVDNRERTRHHTDIVFLCSIIDEDDLVQMRSEMTKKDRQRLSAVTALDDPNHEAWRRLGERAEGARFNRDFLLRSPAT